MNITYRFFGIDGKICLLHFTTIFGVKFEELFLKTTNIK